MFEYEIPQHVKGALHFPEELLFLISYEDPFYFTVCLANIRRIASSTPS